jgi:hypothetical protein
MGLEKAKAIVAKHHEKEYEKRRQHRIKEASDFSNHVDSTHGAILEKNGFTKVNEGLHDNNRNGGGLDKVHTYVKHHPNGHSTMVSIVKRGDHDDEAASYFGHSHEVRAVNTKGTSWSSHYPRHHHGDDLDHSKKKYEVELHDHLKKISDSGAGAGNW